MRKIWLVIKREYLTRVRNKTFILSTILLPLFFIGFIAASAYFSIKSVDRQKIAVEDDNGIFKTSFQSDKIILMNKGTKILDGSVKQIKQDCKENMFKVGFDTIPPPFPNDIFEIIASKDNFLTVKINQGHNPAAVLQQFLMHGASIISFNEILPSLNDIFIRKVKDTEFSRQFESVNY